MLGLGYSLGLRPKILTLALAKIFDLGHEAQVFGLAIQGQGLVHAEALALYLVALLTWPNFNLLLIKVGLFPAKILLLPYVYHWRIQV